MNSVRDGEFKPAKTDPAALLDALLKSSQIVRMRLNDWLDEYDLNDGRFGVLTALSQNRDPGLSQSELAEMLGQSPSNVSTLIERMARDGLVTRVASPTDRRKRMLSISSRGLARLGMVEARRSAWAGDLFSPIAEQDQTQLLALLHKCGTTPDHDNRSRGHDWSIRAELAEDGRDCEHKANPSTDPTTPQFALQQMLLALSSTAVDDLRDERAVA